MKNYLLLPAIVLSMLVTVNCDDGIQPSMITTEMVGEISEKIFISLENAWSFHGNQVVETIDSPLRIQKSYHDTIEEHISEDRPCATFSLKIPSTRGMRAGLFIRNYFSSYRLLDNGEVIAQKGQVSCEKHGVEPAWGPTVIPLSGNDHEFVLQVSFSEFRFGTFRMKMLLSEFQELERVQAITRASEGVAIGSFLIMAIFNLAFFVMRRENKASLYLSLLCLAGTLFMAANGQFLLQKIFPSMSFDLLGRLIVFSLYCSGALMLMLAENTFLSIPAVVRYLILGSFGIATVLNFILPPGPSSKFFSWFRYAMYFFPFLAFFYIPRKMIKKRNVILVIVAGVLIAIDFFLAQITYFQPTIYRVRYFGFFAFALSNSVLIAQRFSAALKEITLSHARLAEKDSQIQMELDFASDIQKGILPEARNFENLNISTLYQPLGTVSGDYFDMFVVPSGTFVLIADIAGHGVPAALVTMLAKQVFSQLTQVDTSPAKIMQKANVELCKQIKTQEYLTAFLLHVDHEKKVTYANAVHPKPLLLKLSSPVVHSLDTSGFMLGALEDASIQYEENTFLAEKGDKLVLFTDGIIEQASLTGQYYGMPRLIDFLKQRSILPGTQILDELVQDLNSFAHGAAYTDDITAMVIEFY